MNAALHLYTGQPETLPPSDAAALCNCLGVLPDCVRDWCGDVVDMLQACDCGCIIVKPQSLCDRCRLAALDVVDLEPVEIEPAQMPRESWLFKRLQRVC